MIITQKHKLESKKIRTNTTIVQISDLHYNDFMLLDKLINISEHIKNLNPSYIIFCGDILFNRSNNYENLIVFFSLLGKIAPVYVTYGNHDIMTLEEETKSITDLKWVEYVESKLFDQLKTIPGINILENEQKYLEDHNVLLTGINLDFEHYEVKKEKPSDFVFKVNKMFKEQLPAETFNEISCHSPRVILNKNHFSALNIKRNADLIHSGHMHNGAVPIGAGLFIPKNRGLIDPYGGLYPNLARGEVKIDNTLGIIGGPLTTISESQGFKAKFFNTIMPSRIDAIYVKRMK